jgi:hypothetical protein
MRGLGERQGIPIVFVLRDVMMRARTRQPRAPMASRIRNNVSLAGPVGSRAKMGNRPHPNAYGDREVLRIP